jgi:hypothetical protein
MLSKQDARFWDGSEPQWALLRVGGPEDYLIVDRIERSALLLDDEEYAAELVDAMLRHGVQTIEKL